jgi:hypothetical protein
MPIKLKDLEGYVERDMDADTAKWFADAERVSIADSIVPVAPFLKTLPKHAATTLASFDAKIRGGKFPAIPCLDIMDDWTYGFDFVKNGVEVIDGDGNDVASKVWSLALDGGGNHYIQLTNGKVAIWFHEESSIEEHTQFDNLDVFLWSMIRLGAVRKKKLAKQDIANDFEILAQPGALFLLKELR